MKLRIYRVFVAVIVIAGWMSRDALAHPGHEHDDGAPAPAVPAHRQQQVIELNTGAIKPLRVPVAVPTDDDADADAEQCDGEVAAAAPAIHDHFTPFAAALKLRWDDRHYYVGSNGMPDHPMMIGIRAWQQQVPLPQKYFDDNAWRIPLHPVPAKEPASAKNRFLARRHCTGRQRRADLQSSQQSR